MDDEIEIFRMNCKRCTDDLVCKRVKEGYYCNVDEKILYPFSKDDMLKHLRFYIVDENKKYCKMVKDKGGIDKIYEKHRIMYSWRK